MQDLQASSVQRDNCRFTAISDAPVPTCSARPLELGKLPAFSPFEAEPCRISTSTLSLRPIGAMHTCVRHQRPSPYSSQAAVVSSSIASTCTRNKVTETRLRRPCTKLCPDKRRVDLSARAIQAADRVSLQLKLWQLQVLSADCIDVSQMTAETQSLPAATLSQHTPPMKVLARCSAVWSQLADRWAQLGLCVARHCSTVQVNCAPT